VFTVARSPGCISALIRPSTRASEPVTNS
jgi:hypothetical protein